MGDIFAKLGIWSADGSNLRDVDMRVDTGASYSQLPGDMFVELGWTPSLPPRYADLADGTQTMVELGEVKIQYNEDALSRIFIFSESGCPELLGSDTLQGLGMGVDPVNHRLINVVAHR